MQEKLKNVGYFFLAFIGIVLIVFFFIKGGLWLSEFLSPWLSIISGYAFVISIFILLPLGLFRKTRSFSGLGLFIASYIFGASLWVWAFLITYTLWGATGLIIGLFIGGVGVVPTAILATLFNAQWSILGQIVLLLFFTLGSRLLGDRWAETSEDQAYEITNEPLN